MSDLFITLFNHSVVFDYSPADILWTVPDGVTQIGVEMWAGGGGGGTFGSGQGGGYARGRFQVASGKQLTITVGKGGNGGSTSSALGTPTSGEDSSVRFTTGTRPVLLELAYAEGGAADSAIYDGISEGRLGNLLVASVGQFGRQMEDVHIAYGAGFMNTTYKCGNGGNAPNSVKTGGAGAYYIVQTDTSNNSVKILQNTPAQQGDLPGGGGGAGLIIPNGTTLPTIIPGASGGNGQVIIYYNL